MGACTYEHKFRSSNSNARSKDSSIINMSFNLSNECDLNKLLSGGKIIHLITVWNTGANISKEGMTEAVSIEFDWPVLELKVSGAAHTPTTQCCVSTDKQENNIVVKKEVEPRKPEQNLGLWWVYFGAEFKYIPSTAAALIKGMWVYVAEKGCNRTHLKFISLLVPHSCWSTVLL